MISSAASSESLNGPDGRTSFHALTVAKSARAAIWKLYPTTDVRQAGYGPALFDVDLGDNFVATVTVEVKRVAATGFYGVTHEGEGTGDWQCYSCLYRMESLTEGFSTQCPKCGSYEIHLTDEAKGKEVSDTKTFHHRCQRTVGQVRLGFEWHGGPYIEVCQGSAFSSPKEVINVWDYEAGKPVIDRTVHAMNTAIDEWIDSYGRAALIHDVTENWRYM